MASGGRLDAAASLELLAEQLGLEDEPESPSGPGEGDTPLDWTWVPHVIQSSHPYMNFLDKEWTVEAPAHAREMRLHFESIELEDDYDWLRLSTAEGVELNSWTGEWAEVVTDPVLYRTIVLTLQTDYSVTEWGFALSGYSWR